MVAKITVTDRTPEMDVKEYNRVESLVNKRVRWELGSENFMKWDSCGVQRHILLWLEHTE